MCKVRLAAKMRRLGEATVPEGSAGSASSLRGIRLTTSEKSPGGRGGDSGYPKCVSWARFVMSTWQPSAGSPVKSVDPGLSWGTSGGLGEPSVSVNV